MAKCCEESSCKLLDKTDLCLSLIDHHRDAATGLLHCVLTRTKTATLRQLIQSVRLTYKFFIEMPETSGEELLKQLILTGVKDSGHSYAIYSIPTDTSLPHGMKVGSLVRVQMNMYSISYVLKNSANVSIAYIVYHVPSPIKVLRDPPSRFVELAVHDPISKSDANDEYHKCDSTETLYGSNASSSSYFDKACMYSISRHHNLSGVVAIQSDDSSIRVMQSKVPYISSTSGRVTLNFRGRGKYASPKNMQLISTSAQAFTKSSTTRNHAQTPTNSDDDNVKIYMQMCKWDNDTYNIDFDAPFVTHLHAFAFGLAQMDI
jgi:Tub family